MKVQIAEILKQVQTFGILWEVQISLGAIVQNQQIPVA
jgi:hypothetical protein